MFICPLDKKFVMALFTNQDAYNKSRNLKNKSVPFDASNNYGFYTDDDYLASISQYKDRPFYNHLLENPWLAGNQSQFSPSIWQQVAEQFGDTQARDQYVAELRSQRSQWLADRLRQYEQQDYDSAEAQVERERQAGLNPDLNGNISPGSSAENDQPSGDVKFPMGSDASDFVKTIGSTALSFVTNIIGLAKSFQDLQAGSNELVNQEIRNNAGARDFVLNEIAGSSFFNNENDLDNITPADLANDILSSSNKVDYSPYSPRTRKLIKRMFNRYAKDVASGRSPMAVEDLKSQLRKRIASNSYDAAKVGANPNFDEDFMSMLNKIASTVAKFEYDAQVSEFNSRIAKGNYDSAYFHGLSAGDASSADNASNRARKAKDSQSAIFEGMWSEIYKICKDSNSWYGTLGLILIPYLRSMAENASFGFGRYGKGKFGVTTIGF